ncbi:FAD-binding protein [Candidatus Daviesbacteria bacterium]|nr:FAD-binding protein [Candidatus Daviesbacteria bacterium]
MSDQYKIIIDELGKDHLLQDEPMARHTTFAIGGPADLFYVAQTADELIGAVNLAKARKIPYFILGGGSKILVGDKGIRGLVIHNKTVVVEVINSSFIIHPSSLTKTQPRFGQADEDQFIKFNDLDYDESKYDRVLVKVDSGVMVPVLITNLISQDITGLEWFARIPASVGGAIYMNMHGANRFLGNLVVSARILDAAGNIKTVDQSYFQFDYDYSILHKTLEVVLDVTLALYKGDRQKALTIATEWAKRKSKVQTPTSAGSIFRNLSVVDMTRLKLPTPAAGYVIDHLLGLAGTKIGQAQISTKHANFIVNLGGAKATDVLELVKLCQEQAQQKLGLELAEELLYVGEFGKQMDGEMN